MPVPLLTSDLPLGSAKLVISTICSPALKTLLLLSPLLFMDLCLFKSPFTVVEQSLGEGTRFNACVQFAMTSSSPIVYSFNSNL